MMQIGKMKFETEIMDTVFKKIRGLMFRKSFDHALIFPMNEESVRKSSIHSLFVFFTFDVLFLDKNKKIVDMRSVKPFRLNVSPAKPAKYIIELPQGTIEKAKVKIGQEINF